MCFSGYAYLSSSQQHFQEFLKQRRARMAAEYSNSPLCPYRNPQVKKKNEIKQKKTKENNNNKKLPEQHPSKKEKKKTQKKTQPTQ